MTTRFVLTLAVSTLLSILASVLIIAYPFTGDQALFATFARMMSEGADLYREVWDVKQPGIFWFFGVAGAVFGFHEIGVHVAEAVYWMVASALIAVGLQAHVERKWIAGLFPVVSMGWYFVVASVKDLTQIEALMSPLIVGVALLLADRNGRLPSAPRIVAAGVLAGVVFAFKFLAVLIPAGLMAATAIIWIRNGRLGSVVRGLILPLSAGFALILIPFVAWVFWNDLGEIVRFTWFEYPPKMLGVESRPPQRLVDGTVLFLTRYAALLVLAVVGLVIRGRRRSDLALLLWLSVLLGGLVVVLQLWWSYLLFVVAAPAAGLAVLGADALFSSGSRRKIVAIVAVVALATLPAAALGARKVGRIVGLASGESLVEYRSFSPTYTDALAEANAIAITEREPIYILGDPLTMQIPGANQAIPVNGWSPEFWTPSIWREVADQLATSDVAALFIRDSVARLSEERAPWFLPEIAESYEFAVGTGFGSWYTPTR